LEMLALQVPKGLQDLQVLLVLLVLSGLQDL